MLVSAVGLNLVHTFANLRRRFLIHLILHNSLVTLLRLHFPAHFLFSSFPVFCLLGTSCTTAGFDTITVFMGLSCQVAGLY